MPYLIILLLFAFSPQSIAETEIEFKRFRSIVHKNIIQKLEIIKKDPLDAESYFNLGLEYMALGRTSEEIQAYLSAIHLSKDHLKVHFNLAVAYNRIKEGEKAIKQLIKAEKIALKKRNHIAIRKIQRTLKLYYKNYSKTSNDFFIHRKLYN